MQQKEIKKTILKKNLLLFEVVYFLKKATTELVPLNDFYL